MTEQERIDHLKYLCEFAQIHQKMALSVHLEETYPVELADSTAMVKRLHEETRAYEEEANRLAAEILRWIRRSINSWVISAS